MSDPVFRSSAFSDIPSPDFADVQIIPLPARASTNPVVWADEIFSVRSSPILVRLLLGLRQLVAPLIGVRRAETGVFDVTDVVGDEALISTDDRHLDFRAAVGVDGTDALVRVTTTVRLNGWRGRLYFLPIRILHGPVTRAMMNRAAQRLGRR